MDLTSGADQFVTFWPSKAEEAEEPPSPATSLPVLRTHRVEGWREASSATQPATNAHSESNALCSRCNLIAEHYDEIFEADLYASHLYDASSSANRPSACSLCSLFFRTPLVRDRAKRTPDHQDFGLYVVNILDQRERLATAEYPPELYSMGFTVSNGNLVDINTRLVGLASLNHRTGRQGLIVPARPRDDPRPSRTPYTARILDPNKADLLSARDWVRDCVKLHPACRTHTSDLAAIISVINCKSKRILPKPQNTDYVALSYVWGTPSEPTGNSTGDATMIPPRTIGDAIEVTLALGYQYLWVDRYCIDQTNEAAKAVQIALMD